MPNHESSKSLFIAIEGVDFSGKTTLIKNLKKILEKDKIINNHFKKIIYTKEPNFHLSNFCQQTRQLAIDNSEINEMTRALIFFANRSEHINKLIQPAIEEGGNLIICDRFYLSTLVYQTQKNPEIIEWVQNTQNLITSIIPDVTYLIQIDQNLFIERYTNSPKKEKNFMDEIAKEKFNELNQSYFWFIENQNKYKLKLGNIKYLKFLGDNLAEQVQHDIQQMIKKL